MAIAQQTPKQTGVPLFLWVAVLLLGVLVVLAIVSVVSPNLITPYGVTVLTIPGMIALGALAAVVASLAGVGKQGSSPANRSYTELASELSQVAGKSEVVINAINDGVIALDGKGNLQLINPAAQQILGWTKQDAMGLNYRTIIKILDTKNQIVAEVNDPIAQAQLKNTTMQSDAFSLQTNSGKSFLAYISVAPVGQPGSGVIVVFRDITAERSDERQRAEFISTASHEMRTPVASIEGYLGLALNPATATIDEKARDFISKAHESAQHLGHLFQDLLDVSKADDHRLKNDPTVIDIVPFIQGIVEGLTPKATEKGLHILYKPMPDGANSENRRLNPVYYVNVDNDHLREVTDNLIENAIKYTLKGDVVVDVTGDNDKVVVSIQDTGIGIPREDQAHLFQKFYRVDNSDTREIGGTGLGLYLCRRLVETMDGRIWVESEYKKGSTFFVELPRIDHDEATRMIEQASIDAERRMADEQAEAERDAAAKTQQLFAAPESLLPPIPETPEAPAIPVAPSLPAAPATPAPPIAEVTIPPVPAAAVPAVPAPPLAPIPTAPISPPASNPVNTPLSAIEANPDQYVRSRNPSVTIPPRQ